MRYVMLFVVFGQVSEKINICTIINKTLKIICYKMSSLNNICVLI